MQPNLTLKNGQVIPLTDEIYEAVLRVLEKEGETIRPARSLEELETEFAELFGADGAAIEDLLAEHRSEIEREERKLERFDR